MPERARVTGGSATAGRSPRGDVTAEAARRTKTATDAYLETRRREHRLLDADEAALLPDPGPGAARSEEWAMRRDSWRRLLAHLRSRPSRRPILDLGCGVGWMSTALARELDRPVLGVDVNPRELETARRAFGSEGRVRFELEDLFTGSFDEAPFGSIVLASSLQYFPDVPALFCRLAELAAPDGEVVILDTPVYRQAEVDAARARSHAHYRAIGVPEMADHYFHHTWSSLAPFSPEMLYRPRPVYTWVGRRLGRSLSPFPMIRFSSRALLAGRS